MPLGQTRFSLLVCSSVFAIFSWSVCVNLLLKFKADEDALNRSVPAGVTVGLQYDDVTTAAIVLLAASVFTMLTTSSIFITMLYDLYWHSSLPSNLDSRLNVTRQPITTRSLPYQIVALLFSAVFLVITAVFQTVIVFIQHGTVTVSFSGIEVEPFSLEEIMNNIGISAVYADISYIRITAELPWLAVLFILPATIVTAIAAYRVEHRPESIVLPTMLFMPQDSAKSDLSSNEIKFMDVENR